MFQKLFEFLRATSSSSVTMLLSLDPLRLLELATTMLQARPSSTWLLTATHLLNRLSALPPAERQAVSETIGAAYPLCSRASFELLSTLEGILLCLFFKMLLIMC
jgi:hypothetical protein